RIVAVKGAQPGVELLRGRRFLRLRLRVEQNTGRESRDHVSHEHIDAMIRKTCRLRVGAAFAAGGWVSRLGCQAACAPAPITLKRAIRGCTSRSKSAQASRISSRCVPALKTIS